MNEKLKELARKFCVNTYGEISEEIFEANDEAVSHLLNYMLYFNSTVTRIGDDLVIRNGNVLTIKDLNQPEEEF